MEDDGAMRERTETMEDDGAMRAEDEKNDILKKKAHKKRKKLLYQTIREQVEFYFSDANLSRDRFLGKLIQDDPNVPLEVFMRFNKVMALVSSVDELAKALKDSEILQVSDDKRSVRRVTEVQNKTNVDECSIYVENVPPDANHDYISNIFSEYGKVVYVSLPKFHGTHTNKGFAFVEFDTPEEAANTLQVFWDKGCCLPTHMPPEKLCSIRTHESDPDNLKSHHLETSKESSTQPVEKENVKTENKKKRKADHAEEGPAKTKTKKVFEDKDESTENTKGAQLEEAESECKEETKVSKSSKKRKIKDEEQSSNEAESEEKRSKKIKIDDDKILLDTDESTQPESGTTENKKRHRKKKKKTKEDKSKVFADGLLILSKKEWKRLRNKYLDMQKHKMNQVKARLYQAQSYYHKWKNDDNSKTKSDVKNEQEQAKTAQDTGRVKQSPGIIVKVTFDKPLSCVPTFKSEAKTHSCVQYIDATEGSWEAYLRCSTSTDARTLVERQPWSLMSILEGDEENSYWEKIKKDRADKMNNKSFGRSKERGKIKLLRKAEKMRGTHLLFN